MKTLTCLVLLVCSLMTVAGLAGSATLAWNHSPAYTNSPGQLLYRLFVTTNAQTGLVTNTPDMRGTNYVFNPTNGFVLEVRGTNLVTVTNLLPSRTYYFAVTAKYDTNHYLAAGLESEFSEWVGLATPTHPPAAPTGVRMAP